MKLDLTWGQVRAQFLADHKHGQRIVDLKVNGAARPRTLIARSVFEAERGFGSKHGRTDGGMHMAQVIGKHRVVLLAYRTWSGLPVAPSMLHAPAFAWWPQHAGAVKEPA